MMFGNSLCVNISHKKAVRELSTITAGDGVEMFHKSKKNYSSALNEPTLFVGHPGICKMNGCPPPPHCAVMV